MIASRKLETAAMISATDTTTDDIIFVQEYIDLDHFHHSNPAPESLLRHLPGKYSINCEELTQHNNTKYISSQTRKEICDYTSLGSNNFVTAEVEIIKLLPFKQTQDDDIIFVGTYENDAPKLKINNVVKNEDRGNTDKVRKNPLRNARSCLPKNSSYEFLDDDLEFLDHSDCENTENSQEMSSSPSASSKTCPRNTRERSDKCNPLKQQVKSVDHNLLVKLVSSTRAKKRSRVKNVSKKVKKKALTKKTKSNKTTTNIKLNKLVEKVSLSEIVNIVNSTTNMLKDYVKLSKNDSNMKQFYKRNLKLLKNQCSLQNLIDLRYGEKS